MKRTLGWNSVVSVVVVAHLAVQTLTAQRTTSTKGHDRLVREVRHELVMLPFYSVFDNLEYKVEGSSVTLLGQVRNATLKSEAEKAVQQIEGVEQVDNQIEVLPPSTTDDQIRRAVYFALFGQNSPLFRYGWGAVPPIHIIVKNGRVTLAGVVDNEADRNTAALEVQKVSGIFSVTNNLRVGKDSL
jgi:osmotically-inducible protein OsmY